MKKDYISTERKSRIATAAGKYVETYDFCGVKNPTQGIAVANVDSEERYCAGNDGRDKFDTAPPRHQKRTPEQVIAHNSKRAAKREKRKAARDAVGIVPAYKQKEINENV